MTSPLELWTDLDDGQRAGVLALGSPVTLNPGEALFRLGAPATHLYLIERGLIVLTMPMQIGGHDQDIPVEERSQGQTLGWSTLIPPHRFTLSATAAVATDLLAFPREPLLAHLTERPEVGCVLLRNVAAVVGQRLQVFQAMWLRQMQHMVNRAHA